MCSYCRDTIILLFNTSYARSVVCHWRPYENGCARVCYVISQTTHSSANLRSHKPRLLYLRSRKPRLPYLRSHNPRPPYLRSQKPRLPYLRSNKPRLSPASHIYVLTSSAHKPRLLYIRYYKPRLPYLRSHKPRLPYFIYLRPHKTRLPWPYLCPHRHSFRPS